MVQTNAVVSGRKVAALRQAMGPVIAAALADRLVVEVMVNPDGKIWVDRIGEGRAFTGEKLAPEDADRILRLLADHVGEVVTRDRPRISATLPETGERFQGAFMPIVSSPAFAIRKRPEVVFSLDHYVEQKIMTAGQAAALRAAAEGRQNLLIAGGTGSGKTTFGQRHPGRTGLRRRPGRADRGYGGAAMFGRRQARDVDQTNRAGGHHDRSRT